MRAVDRLSSTEAEDVPAEPEQKKPAKLHVRGRAAASAGSGGPMQPPVHFPSRQALVALLTESEKAILRKLKG